MRLNRHSLFSQGWSWVSFPRDPYSVWRKKKWLSLGPTPDVLNHTLGVRLRDPQNDEPSWWFSHSEVKTIPKWRDPAEDEKQALQCREEDWMESDSKQVRAALTGRDEAFGKTKQPGRDWGGDAELWCRNKKEAWKIKGKERSNEGRNWFRVQVQSTDQCDLLGCTFWAAAGAS